MNLKNLNLNFQLDMNAPLKTIAAYLRVSTKEQDLNKSKENQWNHIKDFIEKIQKTDYNWRNVTVLLYEDTDSASLPPKFKKNIDDFNDSFIISRPSLSNLLDDALLKKFDTVLVYSHDRFTRDITEGFIIRSTLSKFKIPIIYCKPGELLNSEDKNINSFYDNMLTLLASYESKLIATRTRDGNKFNAINNIWTGGSPPFGYRVTSNPTNSKNKILKIYPIEAHIVKEIFQQYLLGYSPKDIASFVKSNYANLESYRKWTENTIKTILNNPTYTGAIYWNKKGGTKNPKRNAKNEYVKSNFIREENKIIDEETWQRCQGIRDLKKSNAKFLSTPFLLNSFLICEKCGELLTSKNYGSKAGRRYFCKNKDLNIYNKLHISIDSRLLEEQVLKQISIDLSSSLSSDNKFDKFYEKLSKDKESIILKEQEYMELLKTQLIKINEKHIKCENKIIELSNNKSSNKIIPNLEDFIMSLRNRSSVLLNSKKELKKYIELLEKNKSTGILSKEKVKNSLEYSNNLLNTIFNDSKIKSSKPLRLLLFNLVKQIIITDSNNFKIIYK